MLVQLRRVVYLLVLLQFCWSVASANGQMLDDDWKDLNKIRDALNTSMTEAREWIENGTGCITAWQDYAYKCGNQTVDAKKANTTMVGLIDKIKEAWAGIEAEGGKKCDKEAVDGLKEMIKKADEAIKTTNEAARKTKAAIDSTQGARVFCLTFQHSVQHVADKMEKLTQGIETYFPYLGDKKEIYEQIKEKGDKTKEKLVNTTLDIKAMKQRSTVAYYDANKTIDAMEEAMKNAKTDLDGIKAKVTALRVKAAPECTEGVTGLEKEVERLTTEGKFEDVKNLRPWQPLGEGKVRVLVPTEVRDKVLEEMANAQVEAEKKRQEEEERLKREAEEKAKREEEERRKAEEEAKKKEEEEAKRREEEKKKKEEEKRAQEEKARKEKEKREKEEKAKERKGRDGSSSPALVHSPLMVLLLCVLGSILVC